MSEKQQSPTLADLPRLPESLAKDVKECRDLKHVETTEKIFLPKAHHVAAEKIDDTLKEEIKSHDVSKLNHADTVEKVVLPSEGDIAREKMPALITNFDSEKLNHVEPTVKHSLPSPDEFTRENLKSLAASFDHGELKHVVPNVKTGVEVICVEQRSSV